MSFNFPIRKKSCFSQPFERSIIVVNQHIPQPVTGFGEVGFLGWVGLASSAKILLRTSSKSAKKFPPFTCSILFSLSFIFIFVSSCLIGVFLISVRSGHLALHFPIRENQSSLLKPLAAVTPKRVTVPATRAPTNRNGSMPPFTCSSSSMFSSILLAFISVFIFLSSCLVGVILSFVSGCFTLDTNWYAAPDRVAVFSKFLFWNFICQSKCSFNVAKHPKEGFAKKAKPSSFIRLWFRCILRIHSRPGFRYSQHISH